MENPLHSEAPTAGGVPIDQLDEDADARRVAWHFRDVLRPQLTSSRWSFLWTSRPEHQQIWQTIQQGRLADMVAIYFADLATDARREAQAAVGRGDPDGAQAWERFYEHARKVVGRRRRLGAPFWAEVRGLLPTAPWTLRDEARRAQGLRPDHPASDPASDPDRELGDPGALRRRRLADLLLVRRAMACDILDAREAERAMPIVHVLRAYGLGPIDTWPDWRFGGSIDWLVTVSGTKPLETVIRRWVWTPTRTEVTEAVRGLDLTSLYKLGTLDPNGAYVSSSAVLGPLVLALWAIGIHPTDAERAKVRRRTRAPWPSALIRTGGRIAVPLGANVDLHAIDWHRVRSALDEAETPRLRVVSAACNSLAPPPPPAPPSAVDLEVLRSLGLVPS